MHTRQIINKEYYTHIPNKLDFNTTSRQNLARINKLLLLLVKWNRINKMHKTSNKINFLIEKYRLLIFNPKPLLSLPLILSKKHIH